MILILTDFDKNIPVRVNFDCALWWRDSTPEPAAWDTEKPKRRTLIQHENGSIVVREPVERIDMAMTYAAGRNLCLYDGRIVK